MRITGDILRVQTGPSLMHDNYRNKVPSQRVLVRPCGETLKLSNSQRNNIEHYEINRNSVDIDCTAEWTGSYIHR